MVGLEDRILKKNIPGKYTWWDNGTNGERLRSGESEDSYDSGDCDEEESSSFVEDGQAQAQAATSSDGATASVDTIANTRHRPGGIKGRLQDYKYYKQEEARLEKMEALERHNYLDRATRGTTLLPGELSISASAMADRRQQHYEQENKNDCNQEFCNNDGEEEEEERHSCDKQLRSVFGSVTEVDAIGYADAIDGTDPRAFVICHIYESFVPACRVLDQYWDQLAQSMAFCRFLRLPASCVRPSSGTAALDPIGLPAVVIYRGGQLKGNLTPITEDLPEHFNQQDVRWLLESYGVGIEKPLHSQGSTAITRTTSLDEFHDSCDDYDDVD